MPALSNATCTELSGHNLVRRTPVVQLACEGRSDIFLKLECNQFGGSFKSRGILSFLEGRANVRGLVTYTTGNHGIAVAAIAQKLNIPCLVVTSSRILEYKKAVIENYGSGVEILGSPDLDEGIRHTKNLAAHYNYLYVPLFDDEKISEGYNQITKEIYDEFPNRLEAYFPLGSGSLLFANAKLLKEIDPSNLVFGVESAVYKRWNSSKPRNTFSTSMADGLALNMIPPCNRALEQYIDAVIAVEEDELLDTQRLIIRSLGLHVEPTGAIAVAADLRTLPSVTPKIAIVTGSNSPNQL